MEEVELSPEDEQLSMIKSAFNLENSSNYNQDKLALAMENSKTIIPARENSYVKDTKRNTTSLKSGNISIYIIPANMKVRAENHIEIRRY